MGFEKRWGGYLKKYTATLVRISPVEFAPEKLGPLISLEGNIPAGSREKIPRADNKPSKLKSSKY